jgi:hypothetical protein
MWRCTAGRGCLSGHKLASMFSIHEECGKKKKQKKLVPTDAVMARTLSIIRQESEENEKKCTKKAMD